MATEKNVFLNLNSDASPLRMPNGSAKDMLNVRVTETACYNVKGTALRFDSLPEGDNTCIGAYEDKQGDTVVFFIHNSNGLHSIYRFYPQNNTTELLLQWNGLNFSLDYLINSEVAMVDNLLFWTDGLNEIRQINVTRKNDYDAIKATDPHFANLIKRPFALPPEIEMGYNASYGVSLLRGERFQFAYRLQYADNEYSVFSPYSTISHFARDLAGNVDNYIEVTVPAINISGPVKAIEIAVRKDNTGNLQVVQTYKNPDLTAPITYIFRNNATGTDIPEGSRTFDAIPVKAKTLTIARNRLFIANYTEGFPEYDLDLSISKFTITQTGFDPVPYATRFLKTGSNRKAGVVFFDFAGRTNGVFTDDSVRFGTGFNEYNAGAELTISGTPPEWAYSYAPVVTRNLAYDFFLKDSGAIRYVSAVDGSGSPTYSATYTSFEMWVNITKLIDRGIGYVYEEGDKLTWRYDDAGTQKLVELVIKEQRGNTLVAVPKDIGTLPTTGYDSSINGVFEIYRPYRATENEVFYEFGKAALVANPGTPSRALTTTAFEMPGEVYQDWAIAFGLNEVEKMSPNDDYYTVWATDLGRPFLPITGTGEFYKGTYERFSNKYLSGTQINGLNSFEGLNEKDLPVENGPINKLVLASNAQAEGTILLAIMQNETESQYLGEAQWRDTQGNTTTAISDSVIGSNNTLRGGYGTINPESVVVHNGTVYWWDATKGEPIRYSQDGTTPLATMTGMREFFYNLAQQQLKHKDSVKVFGGYDPYNHEYLMHFTDVEGFAGLTIAFNIRMKGFTSRYSFRPEQFAKSNTMLFSFKQGSLWQHEAGTTANNFYDTQYDSSIRFISNQEPHLVKVWKSVAIEGEHVWVPKVMVNDKGQSSYMKADWFGNREGMFYGAIRRDINSKGFTGPDATVLALNNGQDLRSTFLDITIENESTELTRLDAVNVIYIASSGHNSIT